MLHSKLTLTTITLAAIFSLSGCNQDTSSDAGEDYNNSQNTTTEFNQLALVTHLTDNIISPTFEQFLIQAENQVIAVSEYCAAEREFSEQIIGETSLTTKKEAAQTQWRATMDVWQQAELMLLGPLKDNDSSLRNKIYSWPILNHCAVDYDVVYFSEGTVNGQPYDITLRTPSRKGLAALDYLLFNPNLNHSCSLSAAPPHWDNLTNQQRSIARCNFANEVANDIKNNAYALIDLWSADDGYANKLKSAGSVNSIFTHEHDAVNRLSDAMFYLDSSTKDAKLAEPLGLFANECGATACPQAVESKHSAYSITNILNNLIGFEKLLTGNNNPQEQGVGFVDYLIDVGDQDTADTMITDVSNAILAIQAYEQSLAETLSNNPEQVAQTHSDLKKVTDKLKIDFIHSLALELPATSAGDND